jgi:hypothetical protein
MKLGNWEKGAVDPESTDQRDTKMFQAANGVMPHK